MNILSLTIGDDLSQYIDYNVRQGPLLGQSFFNFKDVISAQSEPVEMALEQLNKVCKNEGENEV